MKNLSNESAFSLINKIKQGSMHAILNPYSISFFLNSKSGFMCMIFYRRDTHVAEIQMGKPASRVEDACAPDHFDVVKMPYVTLLCKLFFF